MSTPITIQIPEEALVEALQQLPPERRRQIIQQVEDKPRRKIVAVPADVLLPLTGTIAVGGDALIESEQIYDE